MAEENELLRQQLEQVPMNLAERNATMAERDVTLAAERALRLSAEAGVQERTGGRSGQPMQQATAGQPVPEQGYRNQTPSSLVLSSHNSMRVPKFDGRSQLHLWPSRFQTFLTARGLIGALEPTSDPNRIAGGLGGMEERNRSVYRHGQQSVEKCDKAWEFLMERMQGQPVEERMHASGSVKEAWKAVMAWYQPQGDAEEDNLEREFENIAMKEDEDPKLFVARAEGKLNVLSALGIHKSDHEVVRILTRRLPSDFYDVEQRARVLRPGITRSEMEEIVRTSHAYRKTKASEDRKSAAVVSTVAAPLADPHALAVGGSFQGQ